MDDTASKSKTLTATTSYLLRGWRFAFLAAVGGWLVWLVLRTPLPAEPGSLATSSAVWIFVIGWSLLPLGLGLLWRWQLQRMSANRIYVSTAIEIQALAWVGRYLPGKAGLWIAKVGFPKLRATSRSMLTATVLVEQVLFLLAGLGIGMLASAPKWKLYFVHFQIQSGLRLETFSIPLVVAAAALAPALIAMTAWILLRLLRSRTGTALGWLPDRRTLLWLAPGHAGLHVLVGISLFPLLHLLLPESASSLGLVGVVGALAIANVAGITAVFAPAGLGVREVVLAAFLSIGTDFEQALAVAALIRFLTLVADLAFCAIVGIVTALVRQQRQSD